MAAHHGRDQIQDLELAATKDGTLLGMKVTLLANMGAYLQIITPGTPLLGMFMFPGIYKMDAYHFKCAGIFTTKTPTDAYRGAGRPEATYAIERIMDELAHELGLDPLELRRRNWITHEEFPFTSVAGMTYDSGRYQDNMDWAMTIARRFLYETADAVRLDAEAETMMVCSIAPYCSRMATVFATVESFWPIAT